MFEQTLALSRLEKPSTLFKVRSDAITEGVLCCHSGHLRPADSGPTNYQNPAREPDNVVSTVVRCADSVFAMIAPVSANGTERFDVLVDRLEVLQYADIARILQAVHSAVVEEPQEGRLQPA